MDLFSLALRPAIYLAFPRLMTGVTMTCGSKEMLTDDVLWLRVVITVSICSCLSSFIGPISIDKMDQELTDVSSTVRRRERTRSESGKENSSVPASASPSSTALTSTMSAATASPAGGSTVSGRFRRSADRGAGLRERCSETALASAVAALSAGEDGPLQPRPDSPVDSAFPSDSDHGGGYGSWGADQHSSEEELECINGPEQLVAMMMAVPSSPLSPTSTTSSSSSTMRGASALRFGPSAFGPPGDNSAKSSVLLRRGKTPQQVICNPLLLLRLGLLID